jgi:pyrophosphatase PpaX
MSIKAVVFDSDGTLIDGFSVISGAYAHMAKRHGYPVPTAEEVKAQLALARPLRDIYAHFFPGGDIERLVRENGEYITGNAMHMAGFAGLEKMLGVLEQQGLKLAVVTGSNHKVHDLYRYHDIERFFTSIVHSDRTNRAKPDPEGFLMAIDECGVFPAEAIMVGDSPNDIFAGKNGSARYTVGISHGYGGCEAMQSADPDYIVHTLPELSDLLLRLAGE